jgi:AAA15 family ATPase/GTPase
MRLLRARVTNYKSVLDSEWFTLGDLTCLIGKNESGKTALLEALEKLNSVDAARMDLRDTEYPRIRWSEYEQTPDVDTAVETVWRVQDDDAAHINNILGVDVLASREVALSKDYNNNRKWEISLDYAAAVQHLLHGSGLEDEEVESSDVVCVAATR